jgi:hypothetical protein
MKTEYKILQGYQGYDEESLSVQVTKHLADGWDLWGNPFAYVYPSSDVTHICQAVVRQVESEHGGMRMAQEPAGYTVQVPETPAARFNVQETLQEIAETPEEVTDHDLAASASLDSCACLEYQGDNPACRVHSCACLEYQGDNPACRVHKYWFGFVIS